MSNIVSVTTMLRVCEALMEQEVADLQKNGASPEQLRKPIAVRNILTELPGVLADVDTDGAYKRLMTTMNHAKSGIGMLSKIVVLDPDDLDDNQVAAAETLIKSKKK